MPGINRGGTCMAQAYAMLNQQIPSEIYQQAANGELGEMTAVYKPRFSNPLVIIGIALGALILDIVAIVVIYYIGFIVYYLIAIPIIVIIWAINALGSSNLRVYLFSNGFIAARGKQSEVFRWDQIQAIWEKVTSNRSGNVFTYTVQRNDGKTSKMGSQLVKVRDLGVQIMREVTRLQLPQAKAAYNGGQTLSFGKINVNSQGVNNGKELVPWNQIGNMTVAKGNILIGKDGRQLKWSTVKAADVPNLPVLLALVNQVAQGQK